MTSLQSGAGLGRRLIGSSKQTPCPICGRNIDGDCRISNELVLCHYGSRHHPPQGLERGDVIDGQDRLQWAFTGNTADERAAIFTIDKPRQKTPEFVPSIGSDTNSSTKIELARLTQACDEPPAHLPDGHRINYSPTQWVEIILNGNKKRHIPNHLGVEGQKQCGAGNEPWPLWQQDDAITHGVSKWIAEAEGEKCGAWFRAAGVVAISQPGHDHKQTSIELRYRKLVEAGIAGVLYLADNDDTGHNKAAKCAAGAAAVGLPMVVVHASDVWRDLPAGGSIDDAPGTASERVAAVLAAMPVERNSATSTKTQAPEKLPPSLQSLIQQLEDGWGSKGDPRPLSAGRLAEMLPQHRFKFNEMDSRAYVETSNGWQRLTDADLDSAYVLLTGKGWRIGVDPVIKAILHVSRQSSYHPVRQYLNRLVADPTIEPYDLDQVAPDFFRSNEKLHVAMVRKWLIGAVKRAFEPGCQMDYCLVLFSVTQGLLKSTTLKALASPDWFCSSIPENDKDLVLNIHSCWLYELAELESITGRKQSGHLKNMISTSEDNMRSPYGRTPERLKRQSVFCATVNQETFLRDETGNRRYWVVPIKGTEKLNRDGLITARDSIWKAAALACIAGELPVLPEGLEGKSEQQNKEFNEQDAWSEMVQAWMDGHPILKWNCEAGDPSTSLYFQDGKYSSAQILYSAGLKRPDTISKADEMRVANVLKHLGFGKGMAGKCRIWTPPQPEVEPQPSSTSRQAGCEELEAMQHKGSQRQPQPPQPQTLKIKRDMQSDAAARQWGSMPVSQKKVAEVVELHQNPAGAVELLSTTSLPIGCGATEVVARGSGFDAFVEDDDPHWGPRQAA